MSERLEEIRRYWNMRAEGYTLSNREELNGESRVWWEKKLHCVLDGKGYRKVLDIGCGPGFFSVLLAQMGYEVTAVDYTENMLVEAAKNARTYGVQIAFQRMDAQKLVFADGSFDFVISRNVLWNLENPVQAYKEWIRVLKTGGSLMNCDGNFYYYVTDKNYGSSKTWEHRHMNGVCANPIDRIGESLPMAHQLRPDWDCQMLKQLGALSVVEEITNERVLDDGERLTLNFIVLATT